MEETTQTNEIVGTEEVISSGDAVSSAPVATAEPRGDHPFRGTRPQREHKKNPRRGGRKEARIKPEFDHKTVSIRRVTRVTSGGRRFSFSVTLVAGNRKGSVGVGQGKAGDTPLAIDKAVRDAKKNMITIQTTKDMSIPHEVQAKYGSSRVIIMPAPGRGILAGSSVRIVLELAGLTSVNAKLLNGTKNRANNAKVAVMALSKLSKVRGVDKK
jgi:small subunit ribosomal protein S5